MEPVDHQRRVGESVTDRCGVPGERVDRRDLDLVGPFFAERTDDELKAFIARPELTDAERAEFARLGESCQSV